MPFLERTASRAGRIGPRHEVGPSAFLAASIAEGVTRGGIAEVRHFPTRRYHHLYDVGLTDGRRVIVRIGLSDEREAIARTAFWTDQLRPLGVPIPEILARDLTSLFPSLVTERLPGSRLSRAVARLSRAAKGSLAGTLADLQALVARYPGGGRFGWSSDPDSLPHGSWRACLVDVLEANARRIHDAGLGDIAAMIDAGHWLERGSAALDAVGATPFLPDAATATVVVTDSGHLSGLVDINGLCWGDPRFAIAATYVALLNSRQSADFAEAWLALSGQPRDQLFWLYGVVALVQLMGEYGRTDLGTVTGLTISDKRRLKRIGAGVVAELERVS